MNISLNTQELFMIYDNTLLFYIMLQVFFNINTW